MIVGGLERFDIWSLSLKKKKLWFDIWSYYVVLRAPMDLFSMDRNLACQSLEAGCFLFVDNSVGKILTNNLQRKDLH